MSVYDNETYMRGLRASQADAERALRTALSEIARQQGVGQEAAARIPGASGAAFTGAQGTLNTDLRSLGIGPGAAVNQAFDLGRFGYAGAAGNLRTGFDEQAVGRQSGARNIVQSVQSDLRAKANEYVSQRAREDRERASREQLAGNQRALQEELARRQFYMQQVALNAQAAEAARNRQADIALWNATVAANKRQAEIDLWNLVASGGGGAPLPPVRSGDDNRPRPATARKAPVRRRVR